MKKLLLCTAFSVMTTGAHANEYAPAMQSFLEAEIQSWISDPVLVAAIAAQNSKTAGLSEDEIIAMDKEWRAEVGGSDTPLISTVLDNAAAAFLREHVEASGGVITEVFAMDARGLNVAASSVTSDYWQGDEAKFSETFPNGAGAVHVGEVEFDESSQSYQGQISISITDPESNAVIGAITVGLNAEALM